MNRLLQASLEERKKWLFKDKRNRWAALLAAELPGILAKVVTIDREWIQTYLANYQKVEALQGPREQAAEALNPLLRFAREMLQPGEGPSWL